MSFYAKKGIIYNEYNEVVAVITPVLCSDEFCHEHADSMADELNATIFEESELLGALG